MSQTLTVLPLETLQELAKERNSGKKAQVVQAAAAGATVREAAKAAGVSIGTAHATIKKHDEFVQAEKERHVEKVLNGLEPATTARLIDASNPESRTGATSYRVLMESIGWIGRHGNVTINGDITNSVTLDQSQHAYLASIEPSQVTSELQKLGDELGIE